MPQEAVRVGVAELGAAYRSGSLDPVSVTQELLLKVADHPHGRLVYRRVTAERALRQAEQAARLFAAGVDLGPLQGVPVAVKDNVDMAGEVTTAGSKVLLARPPAAEDAPVLARLDAAGAVFVGRTNMTELAYSGIGVNPHFGTPPCALDESRVPGGSSSGTGVAVAAGLAVVGVGSDTGGSVRIPAAVNGIVGLKTTDGLVPTAGVAPLSTTLDTVGPLARSCDDAWTLFCALAAHPYAPLARPCERLTLLAPTTLMQDDLDPHVAKGFRQALETLSDLGHEVREEPLPALAEVSQLYQRYGSFASHEALALYEEELTQRGEEMDPRVVRRIMEHAGRPATDYVRLSLEREALRRAFWPALAGVDAIVAPTIPLLPPRFDELVEDPAYFRLNALILRNTSPFNLLGCPAASVPCWRTPEGLSVGLMVVTRPGEEELALGIAKQVEERVAGGVRAG